MKISICDDSLDILNLLKEWVEEFAGESECQIQLYDNGIDVAKVIKKYKKDTIIIFISGYSEYFEKSFEADPVYFLVKPLKKETFTKAMEKAFEKLTSKEKKYLVLRKTEVIRIPLDDIVYIESEGRKIHIHCSKEILSYYEKLDCLEKQVENDFVRCHKSYLVNMKWIRRVNSKLVILTNGMELPVSRNKLMDTKDKVFEYFGRQLR